MKGTPENGYQQALWRIEACTSKGESGTVFELVELSLPGPPPEISQLTALTELFVADNQLASLPPEIGQLSLLTMLEL